MIGRGRLCPQGGGACLFYKLNASMRSTIDTRPHKCAILHSVPLSLELSALCPMPFAFCTLFYIRNEICNFCTNVALSVLVCYGCKCDVRHQFDLNGSCVSCLTDGRYILKHRRVTPLRIQEIIKKTLI